LYEVVEDRSMVAGKMLVAVETISSAAAVVVEGPGRPRAAEKRTG
jgi:hypothetical protein